MFDSGAPSGRGKALSTMRGPLTSTCVLKHVSTCGANTCMHTQANIREFKNNNAMGVRPADRRAYCTPVVLLPDLYEQPGRPISKNPSFLTAKENRTRESKGLRKKSAFTV